MHITDKLSLFKVTLETFEQKVYNERRNIINGDMKCLIITENIKRSVL